MSETGMTNDDAAYVLLGPDVDQYTRAFFEAIAAILGAKKDGSLRAVNIEQRYGSVLITFDVPRPHRIGGW